MGTFKRLQSVFTSLGAALVLDLSLFNLLALQLSCDEFKHTYTNSQKFKDIQSGAKKKFSPKQEEGVPLLSSECPGWVCYAEKVVGDQAFPFMSKVKSPQQLCGLLIKHYLSLKHQVTPDRVKVVTVMPCYDKKLEAVRPNFSLGQPQPDQPDVKEVDTVLATHELVELINGLA